MYCSAYRAIGQSAAVTIRKISVNAAQHQRQGDLVRRPLPGRPFDERDHAVEERLPGRRRDVGRRSRSDSTRVPPVTPERSPPASRTTGADSPVIADSSTDATPSTISPSPGMNCPASTTTRSPSCSSVETVSSTDAGAGVQGRGRVAASDGSRNAGVSCRVLRSASAWALPRASARAAAKLANRTVRNSQTSSAIR